MPVKDLYNIYFNQQPNYSMLGNSLRNDHQDGFEHFDYDHQDYYTDEPDSSPGW